MSDNSNEETLNHIKHIELMILEDFIKICEDNDIEYYLIYGTQIGAVRHQGFIPWDDDIDVILFREDYEKFLRIMEKSPNDKYTIFDSRYNEEYFFQFGRISLNDTYWAEFWAEQVSFNLGFHLDLFILDKLPQNKIKRKLYIFRCFYLARLYTISVLKYYDYSPFINSILKLAHNLLKIFKFSPNYFRNKLYKLFTKYENEDSEYVTDLTLRERVYFKKTDFKPGKTVKFEHLQCTIPNNDYNTMYPIYGDYMQLPPEEERVAHILYNMDFGKY